MLNFISFMNVSVLNTGGWILTDGVHNFAGTLVPSNVVEFLGVTVNPPGGAHLDLQVENIFVNPSILPPGSEFLEDMAVSDPSIGIVNSVQVVAENAPEPSTLPLIGWPWRVDLVMAMPLVKRRSDRGVIAESGALALSAKRVHGELTAQAAIGVWYKLRQLPRPRFSGCRHASSG